MCRCITLPASESQIEIIDKGYELLARADMNRGNVVLYPGHTTGANPYMQVIFRLHDSPDWEIAMV